MRPPPTVCPLLLAVSAALLLLAARPATCAPAEPAMLEWNPAAAAQLLQAVEQAGEDGLRPSDYALEALRAIAPDQPADALRSRVLRELAADLHVGRLDPEDSPPGADLVPRRHQLHVESLLAAAVAAATLPRALQELRPQAAEYAALRQALAAYRELAARGDWGTVPDGPTLHPGENAPRTADLRRRLQAGGDLPAGTTVADETLFDPALATALRAFQSRHQLDPDGVLGRKTLAALNVPVTARIDQIRVNLERARWLLHDLPRDYLLVDVAGYELRYVRDGREVLRSRTVVGKPYRKTPIFRADLAYLEFAPEWTVPPTILRNDVLPDIRKDPAYLEKKHMRLVDADGRAVAPGGIDWSLYTGKRLPPFMVRQEPGPENPLGRVKFVLPNAHHVYLHDTPQRALFARTERAFSSGCIRVEQAERLAALLLEPQGWSAAEVATAMAAPQPRRVQLQTRVPVLLYYWTVMPRPDGAIVFTRDPYGRDAALLPRLDTPQPDAASKAGATGQP